MILYFPDTIGGNGAPSTETKVAPTTRHEPLKPVLPSTPSAEVLAREFNTLQLPTLDDSVGHVASPSETTGEAKVETKKEEVKPEVKVETKGEPQPFIKPPKTDEKTKIDSDKDKQDESTIIKASGTDKGIKKEEESEVGKIKLPSRSEDPFDYKGFSEDEIGILKPLSLNARERVGKVLKQNKELQVATYLQHPDAYSLTPEYKNAQMDVFYLNREAQILAKQLEDVKLGKPIKKFSGWDDKGNETYGEEIQPSSDTEEKLRIDVQKISGASQDLRTRMDMYSKNFKTQIQNDAQIIEQERVKRFPWVADSKLLDHQVVIDGKDVPIRKVKSDFKALFPSYRQNDQAVDIASDLMVGLIIKDAEIQYLKSQKQTETLKTEEEKRVEPTSQTRPSAQSQPKFGQIREFSATEMPI